MTPLFQDGQNSSFPPNAPSCDRGNQRPNPRALFASLALVALATIVAVVAKISPGFHINAHEPSEDYLIPTKIQADLPPGISLVETTYPRGVMRAFRFSKTPLRVYEGSFTVKMKLRVGGAAPLGPNKIALTVGYQACNQDACLPPTKVPATADLEIAAVDTPTHPVNTNIFAPAPSVKFPSQH